MVYPMLPMEFSAVQLTYSLILPRPSYCLKMYI